jgi:hypothetical protein
MSDPEWSLNEFLETRFKSQLAWYDAKSATNKRLYTFFQWSVVILSAAIPALVVGLPEPFKWLTAALSVLLAIGTAAIKTFKYQEVWLNYRTIAETLKKERIFFEARLGDYAEAEQPDRLFVERVETLVSRENSLWVISMKEDDTARKQQKVPNPQIGIAVPEKHKKARKENDSRKTAGSSAK